MPCWGSYSFSSPTSAWAGVSLTWHWARQWQTSMLGLVGSSHVALDPPRLGGLQWEFLWPACSLDWGWGHLVGLGFFPNTRRNQSASVSMTEEHRRGQGHFLLWLEPTRDFGDGSDGKESTCIAGNLVQSLGWEDPLEKVMATTPVFLPENLMDRGAWWAVCCPWGWKKSDTTEQLNTTQRLGFVMTLSLAKGMSSSA